MWRPFSPQRWFQLDSVTEIKFSKIYYNREKPLYFSNGARVQSADTSEKAVDQAAAQSVTFMETDSATGLSPELPNSGLTDTRAAMPRTGHPHHHFLATAEIIQSWWLDRADWVQVLRRLPLPCLCGVCFCSSSLCLYRFPVQRSARSGAAMWKFWHP